MALQKRTLLRWVIVVVVMTAIGLGWEIAALNTFADHAGGMRGMIASPRPLDYINYDYTPNGHHYAFWAFTVPVTTTGVLLLLSAVAGTIRLGRSNSGRRVVALWACTVTCALFFFFVTAYYYLIATNFFI